MKKGLAMILVGCLTAMMVTGCTTGTGNNTTGGTTMSQETTGATKPQSAAEKALSIYDSHSVPLAHLALAGGARIQGRTLPKGVSVVFEWTASGFVMEGELEGDVTADMFFASGQTEGCRVRVWVDGNDTEVLTLAAGTNTYTLAKELKKGKHTIRIAKVTEAYFSMFTVSKVTFTGQLSKVAEPQRKIEFFGDSITAGTDLFMDAEVAIEKQDGTRTYAALTADALGAEYRVLAAGGWGCLGGVAGEWQSIPSMFERTSYYQSDKWDTAQWQPDVVVINLGTNDGGFMWEHKKTEEDFETCVRDYLQLIRSKYADAHIVWVYGMMGNSLEGSLLKVINGLKSTDTKMHYVSLPMTVRGSGFHPGYEDSEICSDILAKYIKQITGWD